MRTSTEKYIPKIGDNKTVMVIPFNDYGSQIEAARKVEMELVNYGFNVKSYKVAVKDIEVRSGENRTGMKERQTRAGVDSLGAEEDCYRRKSQVMMFGPL